MTQVSKNMSQLNSRNRSQYNFTAMDSEFDTYLDNYQDKYLF